jgi:hypothetical protein
MTRAIMSSGRSITDHRVATALREWRSSPPQPSPPQQDGNPFAPPPEDAVEQPWQPRKPEDHGDQPGPGPSGQWSDRQPARQAGGLGRRPEHGPGSPGPDGNPRFDPTDPAQRRARYALLSGMWGLFCSALLGWTSVALLLGVLALYWGISSLRMKPEQRAEARAAAAAALSGAGVPPPPPSGGMRDDKPQRTAAVSGIVSGGMAISLVAATFTAQFVYRDYYTCTRDALTSASREACADLLPAPLRSVLDESQSR